MGTERVLGTSRGTVLLQGDKSCPGTGVLLSLGQRHPRKGLLGQCSLKSNHHWGPFKFRMLMGLG